MGLFDTVPDSLPRWGFDASGNETPGVSAEPPSQLKTDAWAVGRPTRTAMNWLNARSYQWLGYLNESLGEIFTEDCVARDSDCEVTHNVALTMDVAAGKVWSAGAFYDLDADSVTADNTVGGNARIDLVVATSAGYTIRKGTPSTLPTEPTAPTLTAGDVPLASYRVETTTLSALTDLRQHGALHVDQLRADNYLRAGAQGGGVYNIEVDGANDEVTCQATDWTTSCTGTLGLSGDSISVIGTTAVTVTSAGTFGVTSTGAMLLNGLSGGDVSIGHASNTVQLGTASSTVEVPDDGVAFISGAQTRVKTIPGRSGLREGGPTVNATYLQFDNTNQVAAYDLDLPDGATLVEVTIDCARTTTGSGTDDIDAILYAVNQSGAPTTQDTAAGASDFTLAPSSPYAIDRSLRGNMVVLTTPGTWAGDTITVYSLVVEYTVPGLLPQ